MIYSKVGLALTESFESCRLVAYQDSGGRWTIGYGHTAGVKEGDTCTQEQAEQWLSEDIQWASSVVNKNVTVTLTQQEFDALVDFVYNLGSGNFENSTLLELLNSGDYAGAAEQFERWNKVHGTIIAGLVRRRLTEESEFKS